MTQIHRHLLRNFVISSSLGYQNQLIRSLSFEAKQAYFLRDYARLKIAGERLANFSPHTEHLGRWFLVLANRKLWDKDTQGLTAELEELANNAPLHVRAAAMSSLAAKELLAGRADRKTVNLLVEASALALKCGDITNFVQIQTQCSELSSIHGNHIESLEILRGLQPFIEKIGQYNRIIKTDFYNNVAWELLQSGKSEAAKVFALEVARSPYLNLYPEWQSTVKDVFVNQALRSTIALDKALPPKPLGTLLRFKLKTPIVQVIQKTQVLLLQNSELVPFDQCTDDELSGMALWLISKRKASTQQSAETI